MTHSYAYEHLENYNRWYNITIRKKWANGYGVHRKDKL